MVKLPAIVTFANQKGGVGKTTLCLSFANYLLTKGVRVAVVDCDFQQSIAKARAKDLRKYGEEGTPYDVFSSDINDRSAMIDLIGRMHNNANVEVSVVDVPGSLKAPGLVPLFVNSDIIVVPFHYDRITIASTAGFLYMLSKLKEKMGGKMTTRIVMIPNIHDGRVGKRSELILWDETRDTFSNYGTVTPKISKKADMERLSTMAALDLQIPVVAPAFDKIYRELFDKTDPLRGSSLSGIQIAEVNKPKANKKIQKKEIEKEENITDSNTPLNHRAI